MKNNILKILIIILLLPCIVSAKEMNIKHFGYGGSANDVFYSSASTPDGGYVAVGYSNSIDIEGITNKGYSDAIIVKFNNSGTVEWSQSFGGTSEDEFLDVIVEDNGNIIVVGITASDDVEGLSEPGATIVKYSKDGKKLWGKSFYNRTYSVSFNTIEKTGANEYLIAGHNLGEGILIKIDSDGNEIWQKKYDFSNDVVFEDIAISNEKIFIAGYTRYTYSVAHIEVFETLILKTDKDGNELQRIEGNTGTFNTINVIDDSIIIGGMEEMVNNCFLKILNLDGTLKKSVLEQTAGTLNSVTKLIDGTYLGVGSKTTYNDDTNESKYQFYIINFDKNGDIISEETFGGIYGDKYNSIKKGKNGEYIIGGTLSSTDTANLTNKGRQDAIISIVKFDYDINTSESTNGTYTAIQDGDKGIISISPSEGYELDKIEIINSNNQKVEYYQEGNNYYFELTDDVEVKVHFKEIVTNPNTNVTNKYIILLSLIITTISFVFIVAGQKRMESLQ